MRLPSKRKGRVRDLHRQTQARKKDLSQRKMTVMMWLTLTLKSLTETKRTRQQVFQLGKQNKFVSHRLVFKKAGRWILRVFIVFSFAGVLCAASYTSEPTFKILKKPAVNQRLDE